MGTSSPAETVTGLLDQVWTQGCFEAVPDFIHPDYRLFHERPEPTLSGRAEFTQAVSALQSLLDEPHMAASHVVSGQGMVAYRWELTGRLNDPGLLTAPLQIVARHVPEVRLVGIRGVNIARLEGGLLIEEWSEGDSAAWNQQMGKWQ